MQFRIRVENILEYEELSNEHTDKLLNKDQIHVLTWKMNSLGWKEASTLGSYRSVIGFRGDTGGGGRTHLVEGGLYTLYI